MSEETVVDAVVETEVAAERTTQADEQVQASPVENQARDQGWVSKNEWVASGRDADEWRPAKEFVDRGELYKSIHSTKRELKQTQAALSALQGHHKMVYEKAHDQAVKDLKAMRRDAFKADDIDQVERIENKIEELQTDHAKEMQQFQQAQMAAQAVGPNPEFEAFLNRNPWYQVDKDMKIFADGVGLDYLNTGGTRDGLLGHVEKEIRRKFPDKFGVRKAAPNAVAATNRGGKVEQTTDTDMSDGQREIMKTFVRSGVMTEAQYKAEIKRIKDR